MGDSAGVKAGDTVKSTGRILSIPVADACVGRVINPLGEAIDGKGRIATKIFAPVEKIAPGVMARKSVSVQIGRAHV